MGMFQTTRNRLVALNSAIVFFVLFILGLTTYFYTQYQIFSRTDYTLAEAADHELREGFRDLLRKSPDVRDDVRRVNYLFWDNQGHLTSQVPADFFTPEEIKVLKTALGTSPRSLELNGHHYRLLTRFLNAGLPASLGSARDLQVVQNIDPENGLLDNLLLVLLAGGGVGLLISLGAGYFLAQRALVPIRTSWEKQQTFVADASHELRTPLAVIQANLELLFRHPQQTIEEQSTRIYTAFNEVKRLSKLVSELLTLARAGTAEPEFSFQKFDFVKMLYEVAGPFEQFAIAKQKKLVSDAHGPIEITGDEDRLRQLLLILLDNALNYTPAGGEIRVLCRQQKQRLYVEVSDTGVGISSADLPHIFDRFYRSDKSRTRSESGAGLGLSIAQWIVEGHSGNIRAESEPGRGTCIIFTLPLKPNRHREQ